MSENTPTLACPHCGETRLWSDEPTTIMYPVNLTREPGDGAGVRVEYTGDSYDVMDEGAEYVGNVWCRTCGRQLAEDDLVPDCRCANCGERIREAFPGVWDHPDNGHHTVCDWREGMAPTTRVARP